jgi:hypothetical protein
VKRREFISLIGGAVASWPLAARGQQPAMPVIGVIADQSRSAMAAYLEAFLRGLGEGGFIEERGLSRRQSGADHERTRREW